MITDYVSAGSRASSRNGGTQDSSKNIENLIAPLVRDIYSEGNTITFMSRSSQTIQQLTERVINLHYDRGCPTNSHAYILGGYVDITDRDVEQYYKLYNSKTGYTRTVRYEEVTFNYTVPEAIAKLVGEIVASARRLREEGIRPCYATVPPASLNKWNNYRYNRGRTAGLLHEHQYSEMEEALTAALAIANGVICKLNNYHCMQTPYLAGTVLRTKTDPNQNKKYILQEHKLYDGVHAGDDLLEKWADKLHTAIRKNRTSKMAAAQTHDIPLSTPLTDTIVQSFF